MFIRFMILLLAAALVAPFVIPGPDGQPIMTLEKLGFGGTQQPGLPSLSAPGDSQSRTLYRYQDEQGNWHFTDQPPEVPHERVEVDMNANLLESSSLPATRESGTVMPSVNPLNVSGNAARLMEDVDALQEQLDQRASDIDERIQSAQ